MRKGHLQLSVLFFTVAMLRPTLGGHWMSSPKKDPPKSALTPKQLLWNKDYKISRVEKKYLVPPEKLIREQIDEVNRVAADSKNVAYSLNFWTQKECEDFFENQVKLTPRQLKFNEEFKKECGLASEVWFELTDSQKYLTGNNNTAWRLMQELGWEFIFNDPQLVVMRGRMR